MDISIFKSGTKREGTGYHYFLPEFINHTFSWNDPQLNELLEKEFVRMGI